VLSTWDAKGLEFDSVVLVQPQEIIDEYRGVGWVSGSRRGTSRVAEAEGVSGADAVVAGGQRAGRDGAQPLGGTGHGHVQGSDAAVLTPTPTTAIDLAAQHNDPDFPGIWEELNWRGLVHVGRCPASCSRRMVSSCTRCPRCSEAAVGSKPQ
jgi:hypothetical protein